MSILRPIAGILSALLLLSAPASAQQWLSNSGADAYAASGQKPGEAALIGSLYDLKQTQLHKATHTDLLKWSQTIDEFLSKGWDESVLDRYFRVTIPVYTTQYFVPLMYASYGPGVWGVAKYIKPTLWLLHLKGQVQAPSAGTWRFWGYGGEACNVAIDGKTVLVSNNVAVKTPLTHWKSTEPPGQPAGSGKLVAGDWFTTKPGQILDIDILVGERGGGSYDGFLLIEKQGEHYETVGGYPLYPIFQLAPYDTPMPPRRIAPLFAKNGPVWRGIQ